MARGGNQLLTRPVVDDPAVFMQRADGAGD
jgi:hypothetical protein